jgi:thiol-disulfide isomerase/thioredoxin
MEFAMVSSRLTCRTAPSPLAATVSALLFFAAASCSSSVAPTALRADDSKEAETAEETDPDFAIPDGTPEEIMEFVEKLRAKRPKFANRQEFVAHAIKTQQAFIAAGDKILGQKTDAKVAAEAAQLKLGAMTMLAGNEIGTYAKQALAAATKLKADERPEVVKAVEPFWTYIRIFNASTMEEAERKDLANELVAAVGESKFSRESRGAASRFGDLLSEKGLTEEAGALYDRLAKVATESSEPRFQKNAERFEATARRLRLPGKFMALEGKLLTGGELDWSSYRGKVVLVDFWATWCGPCIGELPNVKENYKKYHDKGFEVVGISLDNARDKLEKFIEKEEIPWTQMYDETIQKGDGWSHPMVRFYGINGIPAAILVDKDGKVVSMGARGEELPKLLEQLLGKAD